VQAEQAADEARIASLAYLVWPVAVYDFIARRPDGSHWYRFHMRQALRFGNTAAAAAIIALLWPLLVSFFVTGITATIWLYTVAIVIDIGLAGVWAALAIQYGRRAANGRLFDIPWIREST
jgi:hypothetical protein